MSWYGPTYRYTGVIYQERRGVIVKVKETAPAATEEEATAALGKLAMRPAYRQGWGQIVRHCGQTEVEGTSMVSLNYYR